MGGHFSHNNVVAIPSHHFPWLCIRKDIRAYCRACPECQKAGRQSALSTISEPYQRMACDLVGKFDKTNQGHMYILTIMCLGTRCPYAIPLKPVDAESVAEGLMEQLIIEASRLNSCKIKDLFFWERLMSTPEY